MGTRKNDLHASPLSCLKKWDKVKARRGRESVVLDQLTEVNGEFL